LNVLTLARRVVKYRPDIDGLRAVAVVAIIAFHLGVSRFSGGFVGVDIFYVISGFLIGGIVIGELEEGRFSIRRFYQRRLRRILPALVAMLACTTAVALFVLFPVELSDYAASLTATALWSANIYFWQTTNYFFVDKATPLLHCWSLGVEEQYYLFFPLLAMLLFSFRLQRHIISAIIALVAAGSFTLSILLTTPFPTANFFLLPSRAWELLLGVLVALVPVSKFDWRPLREVASASGLALILVSILQYSPRTPFPGLHALLPCLGTAAVIAAGTRGPSLAGTLLSTRPFVFVGLLSYSLYLWHWPIIVFILRDLPTEHLDRNMKYVAGTLMFSLAVLTWQFVEKPFRASNRLLEVAFQYSSGAVIALVAVATVIMASRGLPSRYDDRVGSLASVLGYSYYKPFRAHQCFLDSGDTFKSFDPGVCLSESSREPNVLLIGDSHAAHLWDGLQKVFSRTNVMQATAAICKPFYFEQQNIVGLQNIGEFLKQCNLLMGFIYNEYLMSHHPELVILAVRWSFEDEEGLAGTLDWLKQRQFAVLVVGPDPNWYLPVPILAALAAERNDPGLIERHFDNARGAALDERFAALAAAHGAKYVSIYKALCKAAGCRTLGDSGLPLMFDYSHLTAEGSELVAKQFNDPSLRR
jgi:peptidoglycan/LPS O-acetylase OafA/YrhL